VSDTRNKILDLAEDMTQRLGFNGFSYLDLAAEIGVKNSSIHYHFKAKADLALALVRRIRASHLASLDAFTDRYEEPELRVAAMVNHFKGYIDNQQICMCGMMAAEFASVNEAVRDELTLYFRDLRGWLSIQLAQMGRENPDRAALQLLSTLEGSLLIARLENDPSIVDSSVQAILKA
jgi:TetR/AcrR family transcriptional repressor of nem operon